ncbi:MAG: EAL domain-containing protein [Myxococcota bacterium]
MNAPRKPLVLIADDDPGVRILAASGLEADGFEVAEVTTGGEALAYCQRKQPDLLVLDLNMPLVNGFEVCRILRRAAAVCATPILIMTGVEDLDSIKRALDAGATDFIRKPIHPALLAHRARYILSASYAHAQLGRLTNYDSLTGLANRQRFAERLEALVAKARSSKRVLALLYVDLDRFNRINDSLGQGAGDQVLQTVADRIRDRVRTTDAVSRVARLAVSRLGADSFAVILSQIASEQAAGVIAHRLLHAIAEPLVVAGQQVSTTASIGIAVYPRDGDDPASLVRCADVAMHNAKQHGGNNVRFFSSSMNTASRRRLTLENALREALKREEFCLHYQPKVDLASGRVTGMEALLRWEHPEMGTISPVEFIPIAEETGSMVGIGEWVLRTACGQNKAWQDAGLEKLRIAVNVSSVQFVHQDLLQTVERALRDTRLAPEYLELEVTESLMMLNVSGSGRTLSGLRDKGVHVALDDFGTGYSSLAYLRSFPLDSLKIDSSFVADLTLDAGADGIIQAILAMAKVLELNVVAEGVETEDQADFLRSHGCNEIQGWLFSKALPAAEFENLVRRAVESAT